MNRAIAPQVHSFGQLKLLPPRIIILPNGIRIYVESGSEADVNRLSIALPGGIAEEPEAGLAGCTASVLSEGTRSFSGADIAARMEYAGAWTGTSVSTHYTTITLSSLNDKFESLLPMFTEIIFHPTFPDEAVSGIVRRNAARIDIERRKVTFLADEAIRPIAYGKTSPLSRTESSETLLGLTPDRLRDFHYSRLDPLGIHIFISGNVTQKIESLVVETFSRVLPSSPAIIAPLSFSPVTDDSPKVHVELPGAQQSAVKIMIPAIGRKEPGFVPLRSVVTALGGYFGSRLMLNIREARGLTYGISASLLGYPERSFITVSTQTATDSVDEVCHLILEEMDRMKNPATYTRDEMTRLSRFTLSNLAAVLDTPFSRMDFFKTHIYAETPVDYFGQQEQFARSLDPDYNSAEQIAETLASVATENFNFDRIITATAG